ncbi:acid phosphatase [Paenibacillus polymyxa]|uniref:Membrane-associated phospholipid phosphatase n=1 Tax=Paenibacillus polymyxa TaxID=1406 RepID=A0A378XVX8_PAEPO|nr:phosphatase PAP2 family protein [Paenibacillus polymyxa]MBE7897813.1 phosphatase PAP2 family protein [Paenibacillus polymyxa]MBG9764345.1 phospholipid phosphatase [Paenibacillus polymyxa]MCC3259495.1 phosphatase PAP2 family protein [Paenibacillus polymyxa]QPK56034.1 phosphatase PAP2 family protein [Paenibacillus polymyxa]UOD87668.1 phosphatase PAP2 family protein [Paenibacillus polymyxa ATCC 842]
MKLLRKPLSVALLSVPLLLGSLGGNYASAATLPTTVTPTEPSWGYFVDHYKNNSSANKTESSNPTLGLLSEFNKLWTPGATWDTGTKLNSSVLDANIQKVIDIAARRTSSEADAAYLDDRRNQSYSVIDGLGSLTDIYRKKAGATTTINDVPADATTKKYEDEGTNAGDTSSSLGNVVNLVNTLRGDYSTTNPAKSYFSYPRPFRWSDNSVVVPSLIPALKSDATNDGGFPSGHTNAAYLSSIAMAYAMPERYQELLTRASELGNNRVVAGMHSPLDVMGGRVMATAMAAAILSDPANSNLKKAAYQDAHKQLLSQKGTAPDRFSNYATNKKNYNERLTYGFSQINPATTPMTVPKGAEVLLETRQPYLDSTQRRWVLATTGLPSGYPVLDDAEGWGRLNLFSAADGYGAFANNVTVNMDASKGGFNALDRWRNHISGVGKLIKKGTGTLKLMGSNTYSGGTQIDQGILEGNSETAFGSGTVTNNGGTLLKNNAGKLIVGSNYKQTAKGKLELNLQSKNDVLKIKGTAQLNGKLRLNFANKYVPASGATILTYGKRSGEFSSIEVAGLPSNYKVKVVYTADRVQLKVTK